MVKENGGFDGLKATGEILLDFTRNIKLLYTIQIVEGDKVEEEEPIYMKEYDYDQETGRYYGCRIVKIDRKNLK